MILSDKPAETSIVQPDVLYVAPDRMAVEILSPSTRTIDRGTKRALDARYAVPNLWIVDPDARVIEAFTLQGGRYVVAVSATGSNPVDLPPFTGLGLVPDAAPDRPVER